MKIPSLTVQQVKFGVYLYIITWIDYHPLTSPISNATNCDTSLQNTNLKLIKFTRYEIVMTNNQSGLEGGKQIKGESDNAKAELKYSIEICRRFAIFSFDHKKKSLRVHKKWICEEIETEATIKKERKKMFAKNSIELELLVQVCFSLSPSSSSRIYLKLDICLKRKKKRGQEGEEEVEIPIKRVMTLKKNVTLKSSLFLPR